MSNAIPMDGVATQTLGLNQDGRALAPVTVGTVTLPPGSTPQQRFAAIKAQIESGSIESAQGDGRGHTQGTLNRMAQGDASAALDHKAVESLKADYSKLDARSRETHRAAFEADLQSIYSGGKASGNFKASVDKTRREQRMQDALNAALTENKSPEELKQIIDGALTSPLPGRDASGKFAAQHITGDAALEMLQKAIGKMTPEASAAFVQSEQYATFYRQLRNEGYAVREASGQLQVYNPKSSNEIAGKPATAAKPTGAWSTPGENGRTLTESGKQMQSDLLAEYAALPATDKTPATVRAYQVGILKTYADERGMVSSHYFEPKYLSGYTLPAGTHPPEIIQDLARAKAISLTQSQVEAVIRSER